MTSPSAAHTGRAMTDPEVAAWLAAPRVRARPVVDYGTNAAPSLRAMADMAEAAAQVLVDAGHASWCPTCDGTGTTQVGFKPRPKDPGKFTPGLAPVTGTCPRCRGGRLNPFHGCSFNAPDPCTCVDRCQVHQPQETPT